MMSKCSSDYTEESGPPRSNFTLCGDDLIRINRFSQSANLTFLFDFNVMLRKSDGSWDESNAKKILEFCSAQASYLVGHFKISYSRQNFRFDKNYAVFPGLFYIVEIMDTDERSK